MLIETYRKTTLMWGFSKMNLFVNLNPSFIWGKSHIGAKFNIFQKLQYQKFSVQNFLQMANRRVRVQILIFEQIRDAIFNLHSRFSENSPKLK